MNKITYILLMFLSASLTLFPRNFIIFLGRLFGFMMYYFFPLRKKVAKINLKIAFPDKTKKNINDLIKKTYMHYGILMFEFIRSHRVKPPKSIFKIDEQTKKILDTKDGLIFMTGHVGNWEMTIPILSEYKKVTAIVRKQRNSGGHKFFSECRKLKNVDLVTNKGSKIKMLKSLKNGRILILASDQNAKDKGTYIDFFGMKSSIPKGAGHFHFSTNKDIVIGFCILDSDYKYKFKLKTLNLNNKYEQKDELIVEVNKLYVKLLENEIKKYPEQYFWFHKKWNKEIY